MSWPITLAGFEAKFQAEDDPWRCRDSRIEALKRRRALAGLRVVATALDLACGDGAGTRALAARALRVDAMDGAWAALAAARRLLGDDARVRFWRARAPGELPHGRWRRILISELAYYLAPHEIRTLAEAVVSRLAPRGELITVHHLVPFNDACTPPARAAALLHAALARRLMRTSLRRYGRYEVVRWRRPHRCAGLQSDPASRGILTGPVCAARCTSPRKFSTGRFAISGSGRSQLSSTAAATIPRRSSS